MYMYNNLRLCFLAFWLSVLTLFTTEHSFGSLSFLQVQEILKNHHHHHPSTASNPQLAHSFVFFWKHLTLFDISLPSITLSAIAHSRAVCMMSSSEKCLLGLIHFWTWLQKGLPRSPCWVFSSERAHSMCTCWGVCPSPVTKFTCKLTCTSGADLGGGCRGCPPPPEMTCGFLIQLVFHQKKKKTMWFIGVEVVQ